MRMDGLYSALQNPAGGSTKPPAAAPPPPPRYRQVLYMVENERMGGKVPVWKTEKAEAIKGTAKGFESALSYALSGDDQAASNAVLAYNPSQTDTPIGEKPFGFGDLVDMANPLHHIPVVNYAYRGITGDQIRPISQIVGGAIFGGPIGAASGVVNVALKEETGKDLGEHAVALAFSGRTAAYAKTSVAEELPPSLLAYTAPELPRTQGFHSERPATTSRHKDNQYPDLAQIHHIREPITELALNKSDL